ncbi:MAG: hypothetical protein IPN71_02970 [Fibrobacteres bacterium]|nr:hypothetical protein [Fibrobacterota bacterium]
MSAGFVRFWMACALLAGGVSANVLVPFWGGRIVPDFRATSSVSLDLHQFTEFDPDGARYGAGPGSDSSRYHSTVGFNVLSFRKAFPGRSWEACTSSVEGEVGLGIAHDGLTEFLQNDYKHIPAGVPPVVREGVEEGPLAMLEASWVLRPRKFPAYVLAGVGGSNVFSDVHVGVGVAQAELLEIGGVRILLDAGLQAGVLGNCRKLALAGGRYFPEIASVHGEHQAALGFSCVPWGVPLAGEAGYLWTSGAFVGLDGGALQEWFEYTRLRIWNVVLEKSNDGINGKDYGPTYGVRLLYVFR